MTEKQTTVLGFITLIAVLGAVWFLFGERSGNQEFSHGNPLYPDLAEKLGNVASLKITGALNTTHIQQDGSVWRIQEKDGYPADINQIRILLKGLSDSRILHAKTDNPALYDRLGLGDDALHIHVADSAGNTLVDLDIGDRTYENNSFSSYVRPTDGARSYQVSALPEVLATPVQWLDQTLLHLDRSRISSVTLTYGDSQPFTLSRSSPDSAFSLEDETGNGQNGSTALMDMVATAYTDLRFEDVRRLAIDGKNEVGSRKGHSVLQTFDGLTLIFSFMDSLDETGDAWLSINALYEEPDEESLPQMLTDVPQDVEQEAKLLTSRFDGWAFRLDRAAISSLLKQRSAIQEEIGPLD